MIQLYGNLSYEELVSACEACMKGYPRDLLHIYEGHGSDTEELGKVTYFSTPILIHNRIRNPLTIRAMCK